MKLALKVLKYLVGLIVVLLAAGFLLPAEYSAQRSVTINAPVDKVFPLVANQKEWKRWSVWNQRDPNMTMTYAGPEAAVGSKWTWTSKSEGNGGMEIVKADFDKTVAYVLTIEGIDNPFNGRIDFAPAGDKVKVTWTGEGNVGMSPIGRWFAFFMDKMLGPDLEGSLKNLKELAERKG